MKNLFADLPKNEGIEVFEDIVRNDNVRIERIVSFGPESNDGRWYCQNENEWVLLLKGKVRIIFEESVEFLTQGDYILINAKTKHKVEIIERDNECIWLAVFYK